MKRLIRSLKWSMMLISSLGIFGMANTANAEKVLGTIKFGAIRYTLASPSYTIGVKTEEESAKETTTATPSADEYTYTTTAEAFSGVMFTGEYLVAGHFGMGLSLGSIQKNYSFILDEKTVYVAHEVNATLIEMKTYLFSHEESKTGFNPFLEVATGFFSASSTLALGLEGNTSSSATMNIMCLGTDWVIEGGSFRLKAGQATGDTADLKSIENTTVNYDFSGTWIGIGALVLF